MTCDVPRFLQARAHGLATFHSARRLGQNAIQSPCPRRDRHFVSVERRSLARHSAADWDGRRPGMLPWPCVLHVWLGQTARVRSLAVPGLVT